MPNARLLCLALALVMAVLSAPARSDGPSEEPAPPPDRLAWWRDARFGLFLHWGLYAVPAGKWGEETKHAEWIRTTAKIPLDTYDEFRTRFNPQDYDPDAWCRLAAAAGMKYVVITSKHHDGFCLWDSAETDFDVASTPYGKDLLTPLAEACKRHGLRFCLYHSILDWHHPDYLPRRDWELADRPAGEANFARYVAYLRAQVAELLTAFPDLGILWFDGQWEHTWNHEHGQALYDLCLERAPRIIVNDRVDVGRLGHTARILDGCAGDYGTPEQTVPDDRLLDLDWETCLTMNDHWGWNEADRQWKSNETLIRTLVDVASKNGNLLLNVGPRPDGTFPPEAVERLESLGRWMELYGEAIHGTTGSPFDAVPWGRFTVKKRGDDSTIYCAVFDWPTDGEFVVRGVGNDIPRATIPGRGEVTATRRGLDLVLEVPKTMPTPGCTVVVLEAKGPPLAYRTPAIQVAADAFVGAIGVTLEAPPPLEVRYTLDGTDPTGTSPLYEGPLKLTATTTLKALSFHAGGPVSGVAERRLEKVEPWPAVAVEDPKPGITRRIYAGDWDVLPDFDALEPESTAVVTAIGLDPEPRREHVGRRFTGFLHVDRSDLYEFVLNSDDGSRLVIDGRVVIDNDGLHSWQERAGTAPLAKGLHVLEVEAFNKGGAAELRLQWCPTGSHLKPPAPDVLFHR